MTSWDGKSFAYDKGGNPTLYKGEQMTWMRGRLLKSYTKGGKKYEFNYDASGERFVKKVGTQSTYYETINGKLLFEERADGTNITFLYGSDGIIGFAVGGKIYFYAKNVFGDVVALYDYNGNPVARYAYDAWGNHKVLTPEGNANNSPNFIGNINPIRYRSYYWDDDVKLYYLHTRWYDPEIGRFVNMDQIEYLDPETINGLNLYAYCGNNPVMNVDPTGTFGFLALLLGLAVGGAVLGAVGSGVKAYNEGARGGQLVGSIFAGAIFGGAMGAVMAIGGAAGLAATGATITGFTLSTSTAFALSGLIGIGGGMASYSAESIPRGVWNPQDFVLSGLNGFANSTINFWTGFAGGKSGVFNEFLIKQGGLMYGSAIAAFLAPIPKTVGYTMIAGCSKRLGSQLTRMIFGSGVGSLFRGLFNAIFN